MCARIYPQNVKHTPKNESKASKKNPKLSIYIYISMDLPVDVQTPALVSSGRDLDASRRSRDVPTPKKRMLGVTPIIC